MTQILSVKDRVDLTTRFFWVFLLAMCFQGLVLAAKPERKKQEIPNLLPKIVGNWTLSAKLWPKGPGTAPVISSGKATITNGNGPFAVTEESSCESEGKSKTSKSSITYDQAQKKYLMDFSGDVTSAGPISAPLIGIHDPEANSLTFTGTFVDQSSSKPRALKMVIKNPDGQTSSREFWVAREDGRDARVMVVQYFRETSKTPVKHQ